MTTYTLKYWCRKPGEPVQDQRCRAEPRSDGDFVCDCKIGECPGRSAEPAQEPVAWRWGYRSVTTGEMDWRGYVEIAAHPNLRSPEIIMEPLYTAPPQRKQAEPVQEPVAWRCACGANLYIDEYGYPASRAAPRWPGAGHSAAPSPDNHSPQG